jgi:hypothetical protein
MSYNYPEHPQINLTRLEKLVMNYLHDQVISKLPQDFTTSNKDHLACYLGAAELKNTTHSQFPFCFKATFLVPYL